MLSRICSLVILTLFSLYVKGQDNGNDRTGQEISLLFIGDIMGHDEQIWSAEDRTTHTYNYDDVFQYVKDEISEADVAIANFEVTLGGTPYKGYPAFSSPPALAAACKTAGIDFMVTANNHSADRGKKGILYTISRLDSLGIPHTGTFADPAARDSLYPPLIEKNGFRLAILNYTYGTNGITVQQPAIVNMLDKNTITADIKKAKTMDPDAVILFLHWGTEYDTVPGKIQTDLAGYFFGLGVDLVIGSHPHVIQRMEWTKKNNETPDRLVVYSLGNFVSNQRRLHTDGGTMVRVVLSKREDSTYISDAGYYLTWVYTPIENYRKRFFVLPCSEFENRPEFFARPADYDKMKLFIRNSRDLLYNQNANVNELIFSGGNWLY
jgi:poly-gamma-glutamate synthesis protein (capsule biosynthesis protein)